MAGLVWRSASGTVVNAAIARKSRFPTLSQLYSSKNGNTALESERSLNTTAQRLAPARGDRAARARRLLLRRAGT